MYKGKITIKETDESDLENIIKLWGNPEVMKFVGFPQGLHKTLANMIDWYKKLKTDDNRKHFSIYAENIGYCGETYYGIDKEHDLAEMDIKLLPCARGKGIAYHALRFSLNEVFSKKLASRAYVDPNPENKKAWNLYYKLGFKDKKRADFLPDWEYNTYLEITEYMLN